MRNGSLRYLAATMLAALLGGTACGAEEEGAAIEVTTIIRQPLVLELGGSARAAGPLPSAVSITGERLQWTPTVEHEGEHLLSLEVLQAGIFQPMSVRVVVLPEDASIEYGGCECGSKPTPPRPRAEALTVLFLGAHFWRRRRAA